MSMDYLQSHIPINNIGPSERAGGARGNGQPVETEWRAAVARSSGWHQRRVGNYRDGRVGVTIASQLE